MTAFPTPTVNATQSEADITFSQLQMELPRLWTRAGVLTTPRKRKIYYYRADRASAFVDLGHADAVKAVGHWLVSCAGSSGVMGYWLSEAHGVVLARGMVVAGVVRGWGDRLIIIVGKKKPAGWRAFEDHSTRNSGLIFL